MFTAINITLRGRRIGLFNKGLDDTFTLGSSHTLDVAVTRFSAVGLDTQDGNTTRRRNAHGAAHSRHKGAVMSDGLVGGRDHQHGVLAALKGLQRSQREGRCGIAAHRLQHHGQGLDRHVAQLVEHQKAVGLVAHHKGGLNIDALPRKCLQARSGLLKEAGIARQHQELFGVTGARQRPQAGARTAGHDDGENGGVHAANPCGFWYCQRQLSAHMRWMSNWACQPSSVCAKLGSAQQAATSPARRGANWCGTALPLARA